MKTINLNLAIIILYVLSPILAEGQKDRIIEFSYDESGNRTQILIPKSVEITDADSTFKIPIPSKEELSNNKSGDYVIRIYPNPVIGELQIDIINYDMQSAIECKLYTINGSLVNTFELYNKSNKYSLEQYTSGVYILIFKIGNRYEKWNIVKN